MSRYINHPGYFRCKRIIERLEDFRNLILFYCPYAGYDKRASKPLGTYVIEGGTPRYIQIEEQISQRVSLVEKDLRAIGLSCVATSPTLEGGEEKVDFLLNVFSYLHEDTGNARRYDLILDCLSRGIGVYKEGKGREFWKLFNPIYWISLIIKIPVMIIQNADLVSQEQAGRTIFQVYAWVIKGLMLIILALLARKLGLEWLRR